MNSYTPSLYILWTLVLKISMYLIILEYGNVKSRIHCNNRYCML